MFYVTTVKAPYVTEAQEVCAEATETSKPTLSEKLLTFSFYVR